MVPLFISRRKASKHSEAANEQANTTSLESQVYLYSVSPSATRAEKPSAKQILRLQENAFEDNTEKRLTK